MSKEYVENIFNKLHKIPELGSEEYKTSELIKKELKSFGYEQIENAAKTGIIATLDSKKSGPSLAIRADIDAIPYFLDGKEIAMHTCGHDAHTAMLLATAKEIISNGINRGKLTLIFQPAEEKGTGAIDICKSGKISKIEELVGIHLRPTEELKLGEATPALCHGSGYSLKATIKGLASHAARPHQGINTIDASVLAINAVNSIHLRHTIPFSVKATKISSLGSATNTIPDTTEVIFDLRAQTNEAMTELISKTKNAIIESVKAMGASADITVPDGTPAAEYDLDLIKITEHAIIKELGKASPPITTTGCDDFHYYTKFMDIKAAFIGIGADLVPGLHSPKMTFDTKALKYGKNILRNIIINRLNSDS